MVTVQKCPGYGGDEVRKAAGRVLELLDEAGTPVRPGMKVVLKPNLVMAKKPSDAATTHPSLVQAAAEYLVEKGARVIVADSPGGPFNRTLLQRVYSVTGMAQAAHESGAVLNTDTGSTTVDCPDAMYLKRIELVSAIAQADLVINMPKLKTHGMMVFTGAIKNMVGAVPGIAKADYHLRMSDYDRFADILIDIFLACKPALNIVDAVTCMEGHGPTGGRPRHLGLVIAGTDGFEVDLAALHIMGAKPADTPVTDRIVKRGLCSSEPGDIEITGTGAGFETHPFDMPSLDDLKAVNFLSRGLPGFVAEMFKQHPVFDRELCSGCGRCMEVCPAGIIDMKEGRPYADMSRCIKCFCCQELCPSGAVVIKRSLPAQILFGRMRR